jgi:hypothetical protein
VCGSSTKAAKPSQKTLTALAWGTRVVHAHRGDNFKLSGSCQKSNHHMLVGNLSLSLSPRRTVSGRVFLSLGR